MVKHSKKRLTLWQIAELAGTSKSTVSRVLTNDPDVSPETRERIQKVIREQGFHPNFFARGLRGGPTGQIGVLGRWMEQGFIASVIQGIDDLAARHHAHLLTCFAHSADDYIDLWRQFTAARQVDAMILIAPPPELFSETVDWQELPLVLCASSASKNRKGWQNVDSVTLDNRGAMDMLLDHLVAEGCRRFVHFQGACGIFEAIERAEVFANFFAARPELGSEIVKVEETFAKSRAKAHEYLDTHGQAPDAFVCFNDMVALGVLEALKERKLAVPAQMAVTGFDDEPTAGARGLTTIAIPGIRLGQESVRLLFMRLEEKQSDTPTARNSTLQLNLKIRASSRRKEALTQGPGPA